MSTFSNQHILSPQNWRNKNRPEKPRRRKETKQSKNFMKKKIFTTKRVIKTVLLLFVLTWLAGTIIIAWASRDLPDPNKLIERSIAQSTKIYDRTGEHLLYEVYNNKKRTLVELADIPEYARWATILVEDKNFYQHKGVAWLSIIRAFVNNIFGRRVGSGGASTLTQQFIKNAILTNEHSYIRKIKEALLARQIEKKYSKDDILKMYFNEIPYGSSNYGIEAASQSYFGKSIKDATIGEAAALASLPQAPTKYLNNLDKLKTRRDFILDLLQENNKIGAEEAAAAKKELLVIKKGSGALVAPHFVLYIKELVTEKYGEKMIETGGLKIITTLDYDLQKIAEEEITAAAEKNAKKYKANNAALVSIDPKTGQILAMVGSKDFNDDTIDGQVNVALRPRQPGSSFKPIVYAAAFAKGFTPDTKIYDVETIFKTEIKNFTPRDYDLKERGPVTLRQALAGSLNIPAVKMLYLTGIDNVLDLAENLGYTTLVDRSRFGLALVLGGAEVKLLEHTNAFAALSREGQAMPYSSILEIRDANGAVLEKWEQPRATEVLPAQAVRRLIDVMSDNNARAYIFGEKNPLTLPNRPAAAKTGTTDNWIDGWTMGFTPNLVTGVWVGNNNNKEMARGADGVYTAAPIWHNFMARALKDKPVENFTPPDTYPADLKPILLGQGLGEVSLGVNRLNNKRSTSSTPQELIEYRTYREPHSILFYLNKDDILGPAMPDPSVDPQFSTWEEAVKNWSVKQGLTFDFAPAEYDDEATISVTAPQVNIISPSKNQTIATRNMEVSLQVTNESAVKKMFYYIDNEIALEKIEPPFNVSLRLAETSRGFHSLKTRALGADGVYSDATVDFNLTAAQEKPTIEWLYPSDGVVLEQTFFPISLKIKVYQLEKIKKITLARQNKDGKKVFGSFENPQEKILLISWNKAPTIGEYTLTSEITATNDETYQGQEVKMVIK